MVIVEQKQWGLPSKHGRSVPPRFNPMSVGGVPGVFLTSSAATSGRALGKAEDFNGASGSTSIGARVVAIARRDARPSSIRMATEIASPYNLVGEIG